MDNLPYINVYAKRSIEILVYGGHQGGGINITRVHEVLINEGVVDDGHS